MKKVKIYESEIKRAIRRKLMENVLNEDHEMRDTYSRKNYRQSPREKDIEGVFGQYSEEIPPSVLRYMRKNPEKIVKRLYDIYGQQMFDYISPNLKDNPQYEVSIDDIVRETLIKVPEDKLDSVKDKLPDDATVEITEDEDWIQDMADDIKKDGTEGTFREWCKGKNDNWDGCSTQCWDAAMATNSKSLHMKVAGAKAFCKRLKK